jgi:hypothetical protein
MYVIAGVVAVVAAIYFLTSDTGHTGDFSLLDWGILGMGIVALYRGAKMFLDLRRNGAAPQDPGQSTTFRRKTTPPADDDSPKGA